MRNKSHGGTISLRTVRSQRPAFSAVGCEGSILFLALGIVVVASHNHTVGTVRKCNGKDSLRGSARQNRRIHNCPVLSVVAGVKDTGHRPTGHKPDIILARGCNASAAGGKTTFGGQGRRKCLRNQRPPIVTVPN